MCFASVGNALSKVFYMALQSQKTNVLRQPCYTPPVVATRVKQAASQKTMYTKGDIIVHASHQERGLPE